MLYKFTRYPVLSLFAALIAVFSVADLATPDREYSELENMFLAKPPSISLSGILDSSASGFAQKYEQYTNEQFLFRDGWISLKSLSESALFKVENNGIVYGSDGFLFDKLTELDDKRRVRNLSILEDFARLYPDLPKTLLVAPSAYAMLPDKLPVGLQVVDQLAGLQSLAQQLVPAGWGYVDVATGMREADVQQQALYYRTDHHWTTLGAYVAYAQYCLQRGMEPVAYQPTVATRKFYGTHFSKSKRVGAKPDTIEYCALPVDAVLIEGAPVQGLYDFAKLETRDKYAMFLYGNNGVTVIENAQAERGTVVILKDSYANCFASFLTQHYKKVVVVDLRFLKNPLSELLAAQQPEELLLVYNYKNVVTDSDLPRMKY